MPTRVFSIEASSTNIKGSFKEGAPIYLDMQATSPMDPRVLDAMLPFQMHKFGNPHSVTHAFGWDAEEAVEVAREHVSSLIGSSDPREIVFTSGATESNNIAVKGLAKFYKSKTHIITTQTEHKCVLDSCRSLSEEGYNITYLPVQKNGLIDLKVFEDSITPETGFVSVMMVNNEIGVIQPIKEIGEICRKHKIFLHVDAAQAFGKIPIDVNEMNIDVMSISGHKIYGPKGVGALYVRKRSPRVRLARIISGGGQERGHRSGTLPTPLIVGMGEAAKVAKQEMENDAEWIDYLSAKLWKGIQERVDHVELNGDEKERYLGNLNVSFAFVEGESLLMAIKEIAVSSGSACTSASLEPSYVLRALGVSDELAHTSIRFGIGRFTTEAEVDYALDLLEKHVGRLRDMSPLYEMMQDRKSVV